MRRVRLPVNPESKRGVVLGEGKPENQNHAIIFCHNEALQSIDMNQVWCWCMLHPMAYKCARSALTILPSCALLTGQQPGGGSEGTQPAG